MEGMTAWHLIGYLVIGYFVALGIYMSLKDIKNDL